MSTADSFASSDNIVPHPAAQGVTLHDSLRLMRARHDHIRALCDRLETLADHLPGPVDSALYDEIDDGLTSSNMIVDADVLLMHHHFQNVPPSLVALWAQVRTMHAEQEGLAQELSLALEPLGSGQPVSNAEATGYMLRCFFQGYRRLLLIDELCLLAMAGERLSEGEWTLVSGGWPSAPISAS